MWLIFSVLTVCALLLVAKLLVLRCLGVCWHGQ